jgi:hypothetical protein
MNDPMAFTITTTHGDYSTKYGAVAAALLTTFGDAVVWLDGPPMEMPEGTSAWDDFHHAWTELRSAVA